MNLVEIPCDYQRSGSEPCGYREKGKILIYGDQPVPPSIITCPQCKGTGVKSVTKEFVEAEINDLIEVRNEANKEIKNWRKILNKFICCVLLLVSSGCEICDPCSYSRSGGVILTGVDLVVLKENNLITRIDLVKSDENHQLLKSWQVCFANDEAKQQFIDITKVDFTSPNSRSQIKFHNVQVRGLHAADTDNNKIFIAKEFKINSI